jgi:rhodanese-related sulfurtransferase
VPFSVDRGETQRLIAEGAHLVEVLPSEDYESEHLPGAVNIPLTSLDRETVAHLDRDEPVVVYCWDTR